MGGFLWLTIPLSLFLDLWGLRPFGLTGIKIVVLLVIVKAVFGSWFKRRKWKIAK
jgi:hypothetical protein